MSRQLAGFETPVIRRLGQPPEQPQAVQPFGLAGLIGEPGRLQPPQPREGLVVEGEPAVAPEHRHRVADLIEGEGVGGDVSAQGVGGGLALGDVGGPHGDVAGSEGQGLDQQRPARAGDLGPAHAFRRSPRDRDGAAEGFGARLQAEPRGSGMVEVPGAHRAEPGAVHQHRIPAGRRHPRRVRIGVDEGAQARVASLIFDTAGRPRDAQPRHGPSRPPVDPQIADPQAASLAALDQSLQRLGMVAADRGDGLEHRSSPRRDTQFGGESSQGRLAGRHAGAGTADRDQDCLVRIRPGVGEGEPPLNAHQDSRRLDPPRRAQPTRHRQACGAAGGRAKTGGDNDRREQNREVLLKPRWRKPAGGAIPPALSLEPQPCHSAGKVKSGRTSQMRIYAVVGIVTLLSLLLYFYMGLRVGQGRSKYNVPAPAIHGHPDFERLFRVQANTLEWLPIYLVSLWLFALYWDPRVAAALGVLWIVGRILYMTGYSRAATARSTGFAIQMVATAILLIGALGRLVWLLVTPAATI